MTESHQPGNERDRNNVIDDLESRITRIEAHLGIAPERQANSVRTPSPGQEASRPPARPGLEVRIGTFGFAWIGSIVLLLGIIFTMEYTTRLGLGIVSTLLGYATVAGLYFFARIWKEKAPYIYRVNYATSLLLLYYTTLRLHFFTEDPVIGSAWLAFLLLLMVVGFILYLSLSRQVQILSVLSVVLGLLSAIVFDYAPASLTLLLVLSTLTVFLAWKKDWWSLLITTVVLVYATHLIWLSGNPIAGNRPMLEAGDSSGLIFLFLYAAVFSLPMLSFSEGSASEPSHIALVLFNGLGFGLTALITVAIHYSQDYAPVFLAITCFALPGSMILWQRTHRQLAPSIYAGFGFTALSIALFGYSGVPVAFLWLALETFLVASMALWFRSKILIVANAIIFLAIITFYVATSPSVTGVNFSLALVAILSARILNWQRDRLTLTTENLRNLYLVIAFFFMLIALKNAMPQNLVSLSWTAAAAAYLVLSQILRNVKYRYLAIATMLVAIGYLFMVDLSRLDLIYRVVAFLFLGLITLAISLFYARSKNRPDRQEK